MEMKKCRHAFTLIELLVVIAIIALLLSILLPSLNAAKRIAQTLMCSSNIKNYGSALHAYAMDNNDKAPFRSTWLFSQATIDNAEANFVDRRCMWHNDRDEADGSLWPYMDNEDAHLCPVFKRYALQMGKAGAPCKDNHSLLTPFEPRYSYAMNMFIGYDWASMLRLGTEAVEIRQISMKLSRITKASTCFAFSEENLWTISAESREDARTYSATVLNDNILWVNANKDKPDGATDNIATYHGVNENKRDEGKGNVVYVDGHVETRRGRPGRDAYLEYGKPYPGHEDMNIW